MITSRLGLKLFIDGVEVPVIGAQCVFTEGKSATASIQIIPTDLAYDIPARSSIMLFYFNSVESEYLKGHGQQEMNRVVGAPQGIPSDAASWSLLFYGELLGIGFNRDASSRSITLQCSDPTNYLDSIKQHGSNYKSAGPESIENVFMGVDMRSTESKSSARKELNTKIEEWITTTRDEKGDLNLFHGIHRVIRELFFAGNVFYARAFNRLRIGDLIVGLKEDKTAKNLMSLKYFKKYLKEKIQAGGGLISAREILNMLLEPVLHNYVTIPCPAFDFSGDPHVFPKPTDEDDHLYQAMILRGNKYVLNYVIVKPDCWFVTPPTCNIIFPHMYTNIQVGRNFAQEPTRMLMRTEDFVRGNPWTSSGTTFKKMQADHLTGARLPKITTEQKDTMDDPGYARWTAEGANSNLAMGDWIPGMEPKSGVSRSKYLKDRIYAPDIEAFDALMDAKGGYLSRLHSVEMPHEVFSGPVTVFSWEQNMGKYVPNKTRRQYLSFFTDYLFWKFRFGTRQASVTMAFNSNVVPGYPAVVYNAIKKGVPRRHWVGHVVSVTHAFTQEGAHTYMTMTGVRHHTENADFDNPDGEGDKTLEEMVMKFKANDDSEDTTKAFFDDRYKADQIGDEVYGPLLGSRSLIDLAAELDIDDELVAKWKSGDDSEIPVLPTLGNFTPEQVAKQKGDADEPMSVAYAVTALEQLYGTAESEQMDMSTFALSIVTRNKTPLPAILPDSFQDGFSGDPSEGISLLAGYSALGFLGSATDPAHADIVGGSDEYKSGKWNSTVVKEGNSYVKRDVEAGETASYGIAAEIETRREAVKAYVNSLLQRGLRG